MPGVIQENAFKTVKINQLHPTFAAEIEGVDFSSVSEDTFSDIIAALSKYGVCVFRNTGLTDESHVELSRRFGDLDDIKRYLVGGRKSRFPFYELFDATNLDENGDILDPESPRAHYSRGNGMFHTDSSFNPRRASFSLLRAVEIPPPNTGGDTEFADSRTAFDELPGGLKNDLLSHDYVVAHSLAHSRKVASPEFFKDLDPTGQTMSLHQMIQEHEPSGRMTIYLGAHAHHIEGLSHETSRDLISAIQKHMTQNKFTLNIQWHNVGDLLIWDNRCVLHRATGGSFEGNFKRDLRRTTVHDDSSTAWGLNREGQSAPGFDSWRRPTAK